MPLTTEQINQSVLDHLRSLDLPPIFLFMCGTHTGKKMEAIGYGTGVYPIQYVELGCRLAAEAEGWAQDTQRAMQEDFIEAKENAPE